VAYVTAEPGLATVTEPTAIGEELQTVPDVAAVEDNVRVALPFVNSCWNDGKPVPVKVIVAVAWAISETIRVGSPRYLTQNYSVRSHRDEKLMRGSCYGPVAMVNDALMTTPIWVFPRAIVVPSEMLATETRHASPALREAKS
jgi:hypothetical protein